MVTINHTPGILMDIGRNSGRFLMMEGADGNRQACTFDQSRMTVTGNGRVHYQTPFFVLNFSRAAFNGLAESGARLYAGCPDWHGQLIIFDPSDPRRRAFVPRAVFWLALETGLHLLANYDTNQTINTYRGSPSHGATPICRPFPSTRSSKLPA